MLIKEFINTKLPLLKVQHSVKEALQIMKDFHLGNLSAFLDGQYGILSYRALKTLPKEVSLAEANHLLINTYISPYSHLWECSRTFAQYETEILPVLDNNNNYKGSLLLKDIFKRIPEIFPIANGGAIIELQMLYQDYSLTEISGIIEANNAKITLLSVLPIENSSKVNVTFSINKTDATDIIQALERHNYEVSAWFMNNGQMDQIVEERYDAIMNYMNV